MLLLTAAHTIARSCPSLPSLLFAPPPKYCHQPLVLVVSVNILLGSTSEAKCYLLHLLFLWLCSTWNSRLSIQVCFDFSYSSFFNSSLFPLIYDLWIAIMVFYFNFSYTVHVQSKVCHSILPLLHFLPDHVFKFSLDLLYNLTFSCAFSTDF